MFVIANIVESGKRKIRSGRTVDKVHDVKTANGDRFYIVDVLNSAKGVNWDELAYFTGRHGKNILMNKGIILPDFSLLQRFDNNEFLCRLIFNTVNVVLKELYLSGCRTTCYIFDKAGRYADRLKSIVKFSPETVVITENSYRYFSETEKIYSEYGAGVTVSTKWENISRDSLIIDADGDYSGNGFVFSGHGGGYRPFYTDGFNDLKSFCPPYIDVNDFLGALRFFNGEKRLDEAICRVMDCDGEKITVSQLTDNIKKTLFTSVRNDKSLVFYI